MHYKCSWKIKHNHLQSVYIYNVYHSAFVIRIEFVVVGNNDNALYFASVFFVFLLTSSAPWLSA